MSAVGHTTRCLACLLLPAGLVGASALQRAMDPAMAGRAGAAVALDAKSGRVLAAYHPDVAAAPPGSAVKPFVLAALLDSGKLRAGERRICSRTLRIAGRRLDCAHVAVAQPLDAQSALAYSCNCWFAHFAARLTATELMQALARAGFAADLAPTAEQVQLQALGEAHVWATPRRLAAAYRKLALAGKPPLVYAGLQGAAAYGTGRLAQPDGLAIAGKTGTAGHAWFAGWSPAAAPEVVLVVFLRQGSGGGDAAPIARQIFAALVPSRPGEIRVGSNEGGITRLPLEDYVSAVLAGESGGIADDEFLKSMAVAVRTYALHGRGRHRAEGFDFCATTHCQEVRPDAVTPRLRAAAAATQGQVLWFAGSLAATYYHRSCAGRTEAPQYVWPGLRLPYLRQQADPFCIARGREEWRSEIPKEQVRRALQSSGLRTPAALHAVRIVSRTPSGRAQQLELHGSAVIPIAASSFRFSVGRVLGWSRVPSTLFDIQDAGDRLVFHGYGAGHGVGLCQLGAARMAQEGRSYRQILDFYYPGTTLGSSAKGLDWHALAGERVEVLTTRVAQDHALPALADALMRESEARTRLAYRGKPQLRIYPNVAAFRDATGEPGWVAASTRGRVIHVQPAADLRATLRHEILHLVVEAHARAQTPLWFREGLVLYLADPGKPAAAERRENFQTAAQMRQFYEAARSRVRRLVDQHGEPAVLGWLESGLPAAVSARN